MNHRYDIRKFNDDAPDRKNVSSKTKQNRHNDDIWQEILSEHCRLKKQKWIENYESMTTGQSDWHLQTRSYIIEILNRVKRSYISF